MTPRAGHPMTWCNKLPGLHSVKGEWHGVSFLARAPDLTASMTATWGEPQVRLDQLASAYHVPEAWVRQLLTENQSLQSQAAYQHEVSQHCCDEICQLCSELLCYWLIPGNRAHPSPYARDTVATSSALGGSSCNSASSS